MAHGSGRGGGRCPPGNVALRTAQRRARWLFPVVMVALLGALIVGDPGRIDRDLPWLRVMTNFLIAVMTLANADAAVRLVISIINISAFTNDAKILLAGGGAMWVTNVIAFSLWYWALTVVVPRPVRGCRSTPRPCLPRDEERGVRRARVEPRVRRLLPFLVRDRDSVQPC